MRHTNLRKVCLRDLHRLLTVHPHLLDVVTGRPKTALQLFCSAPVERLPSSRDMCEKLGNTRATALLRRATLLLLATIDRSLLLPNFRELASFYRNNESEILEEKHRIEKKKVATNRAIPSEKTLLALEISTLLRSSSSCLKGLPIDIRNLYLAYYTGGADGGPSTNEKIAELLGRPPSTVHQLRAKWYIRLLACLQTTSLDRYPLLKKELKANEILLKEHARALAKAEEPMKEAIKLLKAKCDGDKSLALIHIHYATNVPMPVLSRLWAEMRDGPSQ